MSRQIDVAGHQFKTQAALRGHVREILYRHPIGAPIPEPDREFLAAFLNRHHEADEKVGPGIARFYTRKHAVYGTIGFAFDRIDGTTDDFSIEYCLKTLPPDVVAARSYRRATRFAVLDTVRSFRDQALRAGGACPLTGIELTRANAHVDHAPPLIFLDIQDAYLREFDAAPADFKYACDNEGRCIFADIYHQENFIVFHNERATLRLISAQANLSGGVWKA